MEELPSSKLTSGKPSIYSWFTYENWDQHGDVLKFQVCFPGGGTLGEQVEASPARCVRWCCGSRTRASTKVFPPRTAGIGLLGRMVGWWTGKLHEFLTDVEIHGTTTANGR